MNTARAKRLHSSLSPVWIQPDSRLICFCKIYSLAKFLQQLGTRKRPSSAKSTSPWYYLQGTTRYWESKIHTSNLVASVTVRLWSDQGEPPVGDAEETRSVPMGGCAEAWRVRKRRRPGSGGRRRSGQWHRALSCAARCLCTAQSSHAQFPGMYHPQQPPSIVSPHPMVHQQVPSAIGPNVGVGVAAPGPQVGAYQQPQLGHMNWRPSFWRFLNCL